MPEPPEPGIPGWVDEVDILATNSNLIPARRDLIQEFPLYFNRQVEE